MSKVDRVCATQAEKYFINKLESETLLYAERPSIHTALKLIEDWQEREKGCDECENYVNDFHFCPNCGKDQRESS